MKQREIKVTRSVKVPTVQYGSQDVFITESLVTDEEIDIEKEYDVINRRIKTRLIDAELGIEREHTKKEEKKKFLTQEQDEERRRKDAEAMISQTNTLIELQFLKPVLNKIVSFFKNKDNVTHVKASYKEKEASFGEVKTNDNSSS